MTVRAVDADGKMGMVLRLSANHADDRNERKRPMANAAEVAESLAEFRVEVAERFGSVEKNLEGFRSGVETELRLIRKLGNWLLGGAFGILAAMVTSAATIGWSASAVVSEVKQQGQRIEKLESRLDAQIGKLDDRLDAMGKQLDALIRRSEPKPAASPAVAKGP
jgi:hypothetical protein